MLRLVNINNYHYRRGGSDVVYFDHAKLMAEIGWANAYFSMHHPKNEETPWSRFFVDELEFGHDYPVIQKAIMATKVVYSFEAQRKLRALLQVFQPDIAHLHCVYHHLSPSILPVLKRAGIPIVMTAHDLKLACPAYKMLNAEGICERCRTGSVLNVVSHRCIRGSYSASLVVAVESALQRRMDTYRRTLDKVIVPSRFFGQKLQEWGWPPDRLEYVPNYVDAQAFSPRFDPGDYYLYFGRLAPEKGVGTLLRACHTAGVALKVAGTGPEERELRALDERLGGVANFLGYKSGNELHELIRGARAVVLPSEWYENAPMSVLESFALGKPVIGARIGGIPEMILEGQNGWTFESANVDALTEVLRDVALIKAAELTSIGAFARQFVTENFSRERYLNEITRLYAQLGARLPE